MNKLLNWLSKKSFGKRIGFVLMAKIIYNGQRLTPDYLQSKGWIFDGDYWIMPLIKDRDKIWIQFESHYYRVWHGKERVFIALEDSIEWVDAYCSLVWNNHKYLNW